MTASFRVKLAMLIATILGGKHWRNGMRGVAALADIKISELEAAGMDVDEAVIAQLRTWRVKP